MLQCRGVWLPDGEEHLVMMLERAPMVDGCGTYQIHKLRAAQAFITSNRRAVDVGSHVGLWTMQLVKLFDEVVCFEPMPAHRACWRRNIHGGAAVLHPVALGAAPGEVRLAVYEGNSGHTHVSKNGDGAVAVEVRTLDSYDLHDIGFLKIDCEGYERFVLEGAQDTILRERPTIVVEQKPDQGPRYGLEETSAVAWLQERGATLHWNVGGDFCLSWV